MINIYISFIVKIDNIDFGFVAIYASTKYISRRSFWQDLIAILGNHKVLWCIIGDLNVVFEVRGHKVSHFAGKIPMKEFLQWSNLNRLLHIPTSEAAYTWSNGRFGSENTLKRLHRAICNMDWINSCHLNSCISLPKIRSDHHPIGLEFSFSTSKCSPSNFKFHQMWISHPSCLHVVKLSWNINVVSCHMYVLTKKLRTLKGNLF